MPYFRLNQLNFCFGKNGPTQKMTCPVSGRPSRALVLLVAAFTFYLGQTVSIRVSPMKQFADGEHSFSLFSSAIAAGRGSSGSKSSGGGSSRSSSGGNSSSSSSSGGGGRSSSSGGGNGNGKGGSGSSRSSSTGSGTGNTAGGSSQSGGGKNSSSGGNSQNSTGRGSSRNGGGGDSISSIVTSIIDSLAGGNDVGTGNGRANRISGFSTQIVSLKREAESEPVSAKNEAKAAKEDAKAAAAKAKAAKAKAKSKSDAAAQAKAEAKAANENAKAKRAEAAEAKAAAKVAQAEAKAARAEAAAAKAEAAEARAAAKAAEPGAKAEARAEAKAAAEKAKAVRAEAKEARTAARSARVEAQAAKAEAKAASEEAKAARAEAKAAKAEAKEAKAEAKAARAEAKAARDKANEAKAKAKRLKLLQRAIQKESFGRNYSLREVLAQNLSPEALERARALGFSVHGNSTSGDEDGGPVTKLTTPQDMTVVEAMEILERELPDEIFHLNAIYRVYYPAAPEGNSPQKQKAKKTPRPPLAERCYGRDIIRWKMRFAQCAQKLKIGIIDTIVDTQHKAFKGRDIRHQIFLPEGRQIAESEHGTGVTALLAGRPDSNTPGLLSKSTFYIASIFFNGDDGSIQTDTFSLIEALDWLKQSGVQFVNMSFSGPEDSLVETRISILRMKRMVFAAAAGNEGLAADPSYPAAYPEVIAVTAVDKTKKIYPSANRGDYIDVAAPGVQIWTAFPNSREGYQSGTSFAVPFMTATLALQPPEVLSLPKDELLKQVMTVQLGKDDSNQTYGRGLLQAPDECANMIGKEIADRWAPVMEASFRRQR